MTAADRIAPIDLRPVTKRRGSVEAEFRPWEGGRLSRLRFAGVDLVLPPDQVPGFHGDTFWPSPQSLFDWPPPRALDADPYQVLTDSEVELAMRSEPDQESGLQVHKRFLLEEDALSIAFTVRNVRARPNPIAPWQVTRAPRSGLLVWCPGEPFTDEDRLVKQREDPGCWYVHARGPTFFPGLTSLAGHSAIAAADVPRTCKLFTDARGWLAHVHDGVVFLREFPDVAVGQLAPRQGELELFFSPVRDYLELENQGAYEELAPGGLLRYAVRWRFATIDPELRTDRLTPQLVEVITRLRAA